MANYKACAIDKRSCSESPVRKDKFGLHRAVRSNNLRFVASVVTRSEVDSVDLEGKTPLYTACAKGHLRMAVFLLDKGAGVDVRGNLGGPTPLHVAAKHGRVDMVKLLLRRAADVHAMVNGYNALHLSCEKSHWKVASVLLDNGAKVNAEYVIDVAYRVGLRGGTALHLAAAAGFDDTVQLLLSRNADPNAASHFGETALHRACRSGSHDTAELLLRNGADVDSKVTSSVSSHRLASEGFTALHIASLEGHDHTVRLLLSSGADANAAADDGVTPLHCACEAGFPRVAECLLRSGADVNATLSTERYNDTPLHLAAEVKYAERKDLYLDLVELLLEWDADINAQNSHGLTPVAIPLVWGTMEIRRKHIDAVFFRNRQLLLMQAQKINEVFAKHLLLMQAQYRFVCQDHKLFLSNHNVSIVFVKACANEIARMRGQRIGDSDISIFDILVKSERRLPDEVVTEILKSGGLEAQFPIYAAKIRLKLTREESDEG